MPRLRLVLLAALVLHSLPAAEPLAGPLRAHGGLEEWRKFQQLEYDLSWIGSGQPLRDRQLFHLGTRAGRIQSERYVVGGTFADGVWIMPDEKALGTMPARFYLWTPFYFFSMPFVFADPGARVSAKGLHKVGGVEYDVLEIRYRAGSGDAPDDTYEAHFEPKTGRLKLVKYTVTYFDGGEAARQGKARPNAIVFHEWQDVQGLSVPRKATFHEWKEGQPSGPIQGTLEFANVRFSEAPPPAGNFQKPAGAVMAKEPLRKE